MTNEVSQAQEIVSKVVDAASYVSTAPASAITFIGCLLLGYFLKMVPMFPNKFIPLVNVIAGPLLFLAMEMDKPTQIAHPAVMHAIVGTGIGMTAWVVHRTILRKWLDPKLFIADDDSKPPFTPVPVIIAALMLAGCTSKPKPKPEPIAQKLSPPLPPGMKP